MQAQSYNILLTRTDVFLLEGRGRVRFLVSRLTSLRASPFYGCAVSRFAVSKFQGSVANAVSRFLVETQNFASLHYSCYVSCYCCLLDTVSTFIWLTPFLGFRFNFVEGFAVQCLRRFCVSRFHVQGSIVQRRIAPWYDCTM